MKFLAYNDFLRESENVSIDKDLREYSLIHMREDRFQIKGDNFFKEFSVLPYKSETLDSLKKIQKLLLDSIESLKAEELFSAISKADTIQYEFGNVFGGKYSLSAVPELVSSLEKDALEVFNRSERDFILNDFSKLGKTIKEEIIESMRERAEIICCVIEALFFYIRTIDKDNFYDGMNSEEIIEEYDKQIEKSSKEANFSFDGPFSDTNKNPLADDTRTAFWKCEKDSTTFFIQATILPKELYSEENVGGTTGLKFSIITADNKTPEKEFSFFNIVELTNRIKIFIKNHI